MDQYLRRTYQQLIRSAQAKLDGEIEDLAAANRPEYKNLRSVVCDFVPGTSAYDVLQGIVSNVGMKDVLHTLLDIQNGRG